MSKLIFTIVVVLSLSSYSELIKSAVSAYQISHNNIDTESYSAKNYIQDGLIFIVDGIENVGIVTHDSSSTIWVDLVSGEEFAIGTRSFDGNSLTFQSASTLTLEPTSILGEEFWYSDKTVEFVGQVNPTAYRAPMFRGQNQLGFIQNGYGTTPNRYYNINITCYGIFNWKLLRNDETEDGFPLVEHNTTLVLKDKYCQPFYNGEAKLYNRSFTIPEYTTGFTQFQWPGSTGCHIWCIRIYNRALTADEVRHNNEIDRERFGI